MLSGAQLGITVTGLLVGYVAEPLVGRGLGTLLGGVGVPGALSVTVGTVAALAIATVVQMLFGELYPKNLAIANAGPMARWLARSTLVYLALFGWLISLFDKSANLLLRSVGIEPIDDLDSTATAEDLERIVSDSRDSGDLPEELSVLLDRILDFHERDVEHAMIPRARVDAVAPETTVAEVRELMSGAHTRYPVVDVEGEPVGVVELVDLLQHRPDPQTQVCELMRPAVLVPTLMLMPVAVDKLVETNQKMACVIDEFGGFAGILTAEDLAEELVGEISDEHDQEPSELIVGEGEGVWRMDGDVHLDEVERAVGSDLPEGDYETIAGLVIAQTGDLPDEGHVVTLELPPDLSEALEDEPVDRTLEIEVLHVVRNVPSEVRVRAQGAPEQADAESAGGDSADDTDDTDGTEATDDPQGETR
jgi:CBS domain containing-hemolysin-like protein